MIHIWHIYDTYMTHEWYNCIHDTYTIWHGHATYSVWYIYDTYITHKWYKYINDTYGTCMNMIQIHSWYIYDTYITHIWYWKAKWQAISPFPERLLVCLPHTIGPKPMSPLARTRFVQWCVLHLWNSHGPHFMLNKAWISRSFLCPVSVRDHFPNFITLCKNPGGIFLVNGSEIMLVPHTHRTCPFVFSKSSFKIVRSMAVRLSSMWADVSRHLFTVS